MDLARKIVAAAQQAQDDDYAKQCCHISVSMFNGRFNHSISVILLPEYLLIRYKCLEFKVSRSDKDGFGSLKQWLRGSVYEDIEAEAKMAGVDIKGGDNDPSVDDKRHTLALSRNGSVIIQMGFKRMTNFYQSGFVEYFNKMLDPLPLLQRCSE